MGYTSQAIIDSKMESFYEMERNSFSYVSKSPKVNLGKKYKKRPLEDEDIDKPKSVKKEYHLNESVLSFKIGDYVIHKTFGRGKIIKIDDKKMVSVDFGNPLGVKIFNYHSIPAYFKKD